jgi:hypothetical protein
MEDWYISDHGLYMVLSQYLPTGMEAFCSMDSHSPDRDGNLHLQNIV